MEWSNLPNPYDFANPVNKPDLFIGRAAELNDIKYYLDHAKKVSHPINIAILGPRASGKTSVLNIIDYEAKQRGFCIARVELDEADSESQMLFFYKLFDSLLTSVCSEGAYGGISGKTYDCYRAMVDAQEIPESRLFCPFVFPIQYAKAMSRGNVGAALSDAAFKRDIAGISSEIDRPIIMLIDECDVLAKSRILLQKLRNIFMNTSGYMLVITGTPTLFPVIDDVFSPVVRQFKKINVGPFESEEDTEKCIRTPLEQIGVSDPEEIFDFETYRDVAEIHDLTGGRPYEIQLICHFLFKRMQEGRAQRMQLSFDVLDDCLKELESSQDVSLRPVSTAVRNFDKADLSALSLLCSCNGRATFEQIWFAEYVFHGDTVWSKEQLLDRLKELEKSKIVRIDDGVVSFQGDDFDRIYCKYLARQHQVPLIIMDRPFESLLMSRVISMARIQIGDIRPIDRLFVGPSNGRDSIEVLQRLLAEEDDSDPFQETSRFAEALYWLNIDKRLLETFHVTRLIVESPWITVSRWFASRTSSEEAESLFGSSTLIPEGVSERAVESHGKMRLEMVTLRVVPIDLLVKKLEGSQNVFLKEVIASRHSHKMFIAHATNHNDDDSLFHGKIAHQIDPSPSHKNNLGYLHLVMESTDVAIELLVNAAANHDSHEKAAVPVYNLGVAYAKKNDFSAALSQFEMAIEYTEAVKPEGREVDCLILPKTDSQGKLEFEEVMSPDILETARSAMAAMKYLLSPA